VNQEVLAIDIGGTNIRGAVIDQRGQIKHQARQASGFSNLPITNPLLTNRAILQEICDFIHEMLKNHRTTNKVGVGFPGFIEHTSGLLIASPNLPTLISFPLAERLSQLSGKVVSVHNDGLCAAVGEFHFGVGSTINTHSLLHCTLGTGIGGGLVLQDQPYVGENGMALELGHIKVESPGLACGCGTSGCLETRASATAVMKEYLRQTGEQRPALAIYEQAQSGDETASAILKQAGNYLGFGIAQAVTLLDIRHISIGGGLANAWPLLEPAIQEALSEKLYPALHSRVQVHQSMLMDDAGILGAAVLANQM